MIMNDGSRPLQPGSSRRTVAYRYAPPVLLCLGTLLLLVACWGNPAPTPTQTAATVGSAVSNATGISVAPTGIPPSAGRTVSTPVLVSASPTVRPTAHPTATSAPTETPGRVWSQYRPQFDALYPAFRQAFIRVVQIVPAPDLTDGQRPGPNDGSWHQKLPNAVDELASAAQRLEGLDNQPGLSAMGAVNIAGSIASVIVEAKTLIANCRGYLQGSAEWSSVNDSLSSVDAVAFELVSTVDQFERSNAAGTPLPTPLAAQGASPGAWTDRAGRYTLHLPEGWEVEKASEEGSGRTSYLVTGDDVYLSIEARQQDLSAGDAMRALQQMLGGAADSTYSTRDIQPTMVNNAPGEMMRYQQASKGESGDVTAGQFWIIDRGRLQYFIKAYAGGMEFRRSEEAGAIVASIVFLK